MSFYYYVLNAAFIKGRLAALLVICDVSGLRAAGLPGGAQLRKGRGLPIQALVWTCGAASVLA